MTMIFFAIMDRFTFTHFSFPLVRNHFSKDFLVSRPHLRQHPVKKRSGASPNPNSELYKGPEVTARVHKKLNKIKKRKYQQTHNLLSGDTERAEDREKHGTTEWISHWHPNITISICYDQTAWPRGKIPPPLDRGMIL